MLEKNTNMVKFEGECSAAASKRRRIQFSNPVADLPCTQHNQTQNTTVINTELHLSPPSPIQEDDEQTADNELVPSLIPQQNFIINYHTNRMVQNVDEFWRGNLAGVVNERKEMERRLKAIEEQVDLFRQMYHYYVKKAFHLEEMLEKRDAGEGRSNACGEAEAQSCFVDPKRVERMDVTCLHCRRLTATMLCLPCRHLCLCLLCERWIKHCAICGVQKTQSFMINPPLP